MQENNETTVYLHKTAPQDAAHAMRLIERNDDRITFAPYHGGMALSMTSEVFSRDFRAVELASLYVFRPAAFSAESDIEFHGYTNGRVWNGWACPWVIKEVAIDVLGRGCDGESLIFSQDGDTLRVIDSSYPGEHIDLTPQEIAIEGQTLKLWNLGELGWCFTESEQKYLAFPGSFK